MAATGLQPGRENVVDQMEKKKNVIIMTHFALEMMGRLDEINVDSFNNFKLRIGNYCKVGIIFVGVLFLLYSRFVDRTRIFLPTKYF